MHHASLSAFASKADQLLGPKGPYALVMLEDDVAVTETIAHCRKVGFSEICLFGTGDVLPDDDDGLHLIQHDMHAENALTTAVNGMIDALPGAWLFYCFNAEFYFFPFCETRSVRELVTFTTEERRDAVLSYVVDLYSNDLGQFPNAVSRETAHFDKEGYYALARLDAQGQPIERQLDFHGGLRWRFEEHVPQARRKIDRVSLFRAKPGLELRADHTFNDAEYNTYACPWHNNISATICSFRTAKALLSNPDSMYEIPHFWWLKSAKFDWHSQQLLDLGLMEPGQWF